MLQQANHYLAGQQPFMKIKNKTKLLKRKMMKQKNKIKGKKIPLPLSYDEAKVSI